MPKKLQTLNDLFVHELQDLYGAEQQILEALPQMVEAASSPKVKQSFQQHLKETEKQKETLEKVFETVGQQPQAVDCKGMQGVIKEGQEIIKTGGDPAVIDAGLIMAAQKVEHYEMAGYGTVRTYAKMLGNNKAAQMLQKILDQEGATDEKLTSLAESTINPQAVKK